MIVRVYPIFCVNVGTVKYYAQIHLQVWQNKVCTGQGNLPLITWQQRTERARQGNNTKKALRYPLMD